MDKIIQVTVISPKENDQFIYGLGESGRLYKLNQQANGNDVGYNWDYMTDSPVFIDYGEMPTAKE
jgi:hypothetical protein